MISVIGAGPSGSFYASKEKHDEVHIFEEDGNIGKPVSCTGIVTSSINDLIKIPKELIINKISKFKIVAPNGKDIVLKMKNKDLILDRAGFDQFLCEKALMNKAVLHLGERFLGYRKIGKAAYKIKTSKRVYETNMIVGADGPKSRVAQSAEIYDKRNFVKGWQARCRCKDLDIDTTTVFLNQGEFSWIVPEDDKVARVGVIGNDMNDMKKHFKGLIGRKKVIEYQSGIVPLYNSSQKLRKDNENVFLLGDAATQVKATTYGGIIYGMIAARNLADDKDSFARKTKKDIGKELWLSLRARKAMNKMDDGMMNELVDIFQKERNKKILSNFDRNYPSKFLFKLLMREPKLWKLGLKTLF